VTDIFFRDANFGDGVGVSFSMLSATNSQANIYAYVKTDYAGSGFTSTTTAGTEIKATQNTAGLSMAIPVFLTAAGAGGGVGIA
ncbi:hypothetical protein, partial [Salmonella enterica]|uniref:hypothetical protein n=1 Tax=Salmonella enterica TaxID=28901 RepID=UPI00147C1FFF